MSGFSLVGLPTMTGPCVMFCLCLCIRILDSVQEGEETEVDTSLVPGQMRVVGLASLLTALTLTLKILVAETVFSDVDTGSAYLMGLMVR